ncbi:MAG: hypothetical protein AAF528_00070 [Cyanobacteria bacterium P01_C01_bin.121]
MPEEMLDFFIWEEEYRDTATKLRENYGADPAEVATKCFVGRHSKANLRNFIHEQWFELKNAADRYGDKFQDDLLGRCKCPKQLQMLFDEQDICFEPFETRRGKYPQLTNKQFYEQAVKLTYTIASYGAEYVAKQKSKIQAVEKAGMITMEAVSGVADAMQQHLQAQGYLQCELPPAYLANLEACRD